MTPERWQEVEGVLQAALDRPPQERASFLEEACMGDDELKIEAMSLVRAYDEAGDFIEQSAIAEDAAAIVGTCYGARRRPVQDHRASGRGEWRSLSRAGYALGRLVALKMLPAYFVSTIRACALSRERAPLSLESSEHPTIHGSERPKKLTLSPRNLLRQTIRELVAKGFVARRILDIATRQLRLSRAHAAGSCIAISSRIISSAHDIL